MYNIVLGRVGSLPACTAWWRRATWMAVLVLVLLSGLGCGADRPRVLVLGLDGMDPRTIDLLMAEGKMPNFARLRQGGAYGTLRSIPPLLSPIIWTTIATGKTADQHGIGHFTATDPTTGEELPVTSGMRRVQALWNMLTEESRSVAVVGWWATWPPETVNGAMVSDHTGYHFLFEEGFSDDESAAADGAAKMHPASLETEIMPLLRRPSTLTYDEVARFVDVDRPTFERNADFEDELTHFRWALATAGSYRDIGLKLWHEQQPDLGMVYIEATDSTSHLFGHLFRAENLAGALASQQEKYGRAVEEMYVFADEMVGTYLDALDDNTTLMVLSDHGFDLGALHDDPSKAGDMRRVSERFHNEEGILYLYGRGVKAGARLDQAGILDIAPTVLGLLDLPAARDMPGRMLTEALHGVDEPIRVATYETDSALTASSGRSADDPAVARDSAVDEATLARLRSLGYLGGDSKDADAGLVSPRGDRNLAAIHFEAGNYREAAKLYKSLIDTSPEDASLRTSLAGVLGALGRFDQAEVELLAALALQPVNPEAEHNLAVIAERRGDIDEAVRRYRLALRYSPGYEPSSDALLRLTGSAAIHPPSNDVERQAAALAEAASQAARRENYPEALRLLDEAEAMAPDFVPVHQYRSNVGYLMGDRDLAISALEKALAIEPDNALFQENLRRLRDERSQSAQ